MSSVVVLNICSPEKWVTITITLHSLHAALCLCLSLLYRTISHQQDNKKHKVRRISQLQWPVLPMTQICGFQNVTIVTNWVFSDINLENFALAFRPTSLQVVSTQELKPNDHRLHQEFEHLEYDPDFSQKIIFSDKAHFWINGFVNKQIF